MGSIQDPKPKVKHPAEELTYAMSFANTLQSGETLSGISATCDPSGLTFSDEAVTTGTIFDDDGNSIGAGLAGTFLVEGGTDGVDYRITIEATTSTGNLRVGVGVLQVRTADLW
jgi:hypothetical protein